MGNVDLSKLKKGDKCVHKNGFNSFFNGRPRKDCNRLVKGNKTTYCFCDDDGTPHNGNENFRVVDTIISSKTHCYKCGLAYVNCNCFMDPRLDKDKLIEFLLDALEMASPIDRNRWVEIFKAENS